MLRVKHLPGGFYEIFLKIQCVHILSTSVPQLRLCEKFIPLFFVSHWIQTNPLISSSQRHGSQKVGTPVGCQLYVQSSLKICHSNIFHFTFINHPRCHIPGSGDVTCPHTTINIVADIQTKLRHFGDIIRIKLGVETDCETNLYHYPSWISSILYFSNLGSSTFCNESKYKLIPVGSLLNSKH